MIRLVILFFISNFQIKINILIFIDNVTGRILDSDSSNNNNNTDMKTAGFSTKIHLNPEQSAPFIWQTPGSLFYNIFLN